MTAKEYLNQIKHLDGIIKSKQQQYVIAHEEQNIELKDEILKEFDELLAKKMEIIDCIKALPLKYREIIELKYVLCLKWAEIAEVMSYSESHLQRIHKQALLRIQT